MHSTPFIFPEIESEPEAEITRTAANIASQRSRIRRSVTSVDGVDGEILQATSSSSVEVEDPSVIRSRRRRHRNSNRSSRIRRKRVSIVVITGTLLVTEAILNVGLEAFFGGDNREMISSSSRHRYLCCYYTHAFQRQEPRPGNP